MASHPVPQGAGAPGAPATPQAPVPGPRPSGAQAALARVSDADRLLDSLAEDGEPVATFEAVHAALQDAMTLAEH